MSGPGRDTAEGDVVHNVEDGRVGDSGRRAVDEEGIADGQLGQISCQFEDVLAHTGVDLGQEQQEVTDKAHDRGWVDHPIEVGENTEFHLLNVGWEELTAAQIRQGGELDLLGFVELDGDVERGERCEERRASIASISTGGQVAIEEVDADRHRLPGQFEVIDDAV